MAANNSFHSLLHTARTCPFCDHVPDETRGLDTINARICEPCLENIHLLSPWRATLYTDQGSHTIWAYQPIAERWRSPDTDSPTTPVIFIPAVDSVSELGQSTRTALVAYISGRYRDVLASTPRTEVDADYLDIIIEDQVPDESLRTSQLNQLRDSIPTPTIVTGRRLYSRDPEALTNETEEDEVPKQMTFASE